jgi:hypothetical protein
MKCKKCNIEKDTSDFYTNYLHCKECHKKIQLCIHNKQKSSCRECKGSQICAHNKHKNKCVECSGSQICEHNKLKNYCKECDGSVFCEHNKQKYRCVECNGVSVCEHNRQRIRCKECKGSGICEHNKRKNDCIICSPEIACNNCILEIMSQNKIYKPYCFRCYCVINTDIEIKKRYKTKEFLLAEAVKEMNLGIEFIQDKKVDGGCSRKRPDFLFDLFTHTVILECDEHGHRNYDTTCEIDKLNSTFTDLADRPMVLIRFNPDNYKGKSCFDKECRLIKGEWNKRIKVLKTELKKAIKEIPEELITIKYLY